MPESQDILDSCKFLINAELGNIPTGNVIVYLYAHTGTYGVNGKPTGSPLATSDPILASTLPTTQQLVTFTFSGANRIILSSNTEKLSDFLSYLKIPELVPTQITLLESSYTVLINSSKR